MNIIKSILLGFLVSATCFSVTFAQEKEANIDISFVKEDSLHLCNLVVTSDSTPVPDVSIRVYVRRLFGLLPIGDEATTDENGAAVVEFPDDLPGNDNTTLEVIAKIEDDDNFGTVVAESTVNWGVPKKESGNVNERSLAGSRSNAPIYFIVVSNLIIFGIWGTLFYVVLQVFKIKKLGKLHKKTNL